MRKHSSFLLRAIARPVRVHKRHSVESWLGVMITTYEQRRRCESVAKLRN